MPIDDKKIRDYVPAFDPTNPAASPPHWSVIAGMLITVLAAGVTALLGSYELLKTDPLKAALITASAMLAAAGTVIGVAIVQGRKELASTERAGKIGEIKAQGKADLAIAEVTGQAPIPAAVQGSGDSTKTVTETTTETGTTG